MRSINSSVLGQGEIVQEETGAVKLTSFHEAFISEENISDICLRKVQEISPAFSHYCKWIVEK